MQEKLASGEWGAVLEIRLHGSWPRGNPFNTRNPWSGRLAVDGVPVRYSPLNHAFAHLLHLAFFFAGPKPGQVARLAASQADL